MLKAALEDLVLIKEKGLNLAPKAEIINKIAFRGPCSVKDDALLVCCKVDMFSYFGEHSRISHSDIGRYCYVGERARVGLGMHDTQTFSTSPAFCFCDSFSFAGYDTDRHTPLSKQRQYTDYSCVKVGHDVHIGANVLIPADIIIGDGAVIAPGAVVSKDVPPFAVVEDCNHIVKQRFSDEIISDLLEIQWWNYNLPEMIKQGLKFNLDQPKEFIAQFKDLEPSALLPIQSDWFYLEIAPLNKPIRNCKIIPLRATEIDDLCLHYDPHKVALQKGS